MANFNTYQTRQLYVAKKVETTLSGVDEAGDIYVSVTKPESGAKPVGVTFVYKNADGLMTGTDFIKLANITSLKKTAAADMAIKLKKHTVAVDTNAVTLANLVGKTLVCNVTVHEVVSYDSSDTAVVTAAVVADSTNTASAAAFHKALAIAIAKAMPKRDYPYFRVFSNGSEVTKNTADSDVTGASGGVVLVESPQKYIRGRMSKEVCSLSVSFHLHGSNTEDTAWGTDTVADSDVTGYTTIPGVYALADLEAFALGERGDMYRGSFWPNHREPTYMIDLSSSYDVLTIEYFWQGGAENIQKSPRMIQIAGSQSVVGSLYDAVDALMAGTSESSS